MNLLREIRNSDVFEGTSDITDVFSWTRESVRIIIFNQAEKIAVLHSVKYDYCALPGGGIEEGEALFDAAVREAKEETGCVVDNLSEVGYVMIYGWKPDRADKQFCYCAHLQGQQESPNFMPDELEREYEILWLPLKEAIEKFERERNGFVRTRDLTFLREVEGKL